VTWDGRFDQLRVVIRSTAALSPTSAWTNAGVAEKERAELLG
jgi:hypothetical protein